jgi:hypothetical protein
MCLKFTQTKRAPKCSKRKEREETPLAARKNIFMSLDNGEDQGKARAAVVTPALDKHTRNIPEEPIRKVSKKPPPAAPSTPSRHTRKAGDTPRTPEGELSSRSCDHLAWVDFQDWNNAYFKEDWLKRELTLERYPLVCCDPTCGKKFVTKKPKEGNVDKEFKVTNNVPVHVCPNAAKDNHICTFALCHNCFSKLSVNAGTHSIAFVPLVCESHVGFCLPNEYFLFPDLQVAKDVEIEKLALAVGGRATGGRVTRSRGTASG